MWTHQWLLLLLLLLLLSTLTLLANGYHNEPCSKYGCPLAPPIQVSFVPAPPGHTPRCAKPGLTFCESLDIYPQQLIKFLIDKGTVDYEKFLRDESLDNFDANRKEPEDDYGYDYPKPKLPSELYPPTTSPLSYTQNPTRLYNLPPFNATHNRYLPPPNTNPYSTQSATLNVRQSFGYHRSTSGQLQHPRYQNPEPLIPELGSWNHRSSRAGQHRLGQTSYRNPLLEFVAAGNRAKRQSDPDTVSICSSRPQFITPKAALNNQGNWMFVVNLEEQTKYSQLVRSEICTSDTCDGLCSLPLGYTSKCQQQYVQKRLVALEGSGNRLYTDVFWFPHGCMCQVTLDY
ncbi:PREDICTED: uncharacterized protein LOC105363056 [Ceratosolen solmsi marchali]|uniref:Uncharacterized protein LOC105363056 n=1 Tax=Ceratosolen solmsi marchali TaxID=326594 RepID=A0AAJ7DWG3_9HYME|nr:PREDICTED: uncharacterized protein LOC105363056 [Ceratosolen solmsi marchali]